MAKFRNSLPHFKQFSVLFLTIICASVINVIRKKVAHVPVCFILTRIWLRVNNVKLSTLLDLKQGWTKYLSIVTSVCPKISFILWKLDVTKWNGSHYVIINYSIIREWKGNDLILVTDSDFGRRNQHRVYPSKNSVGRQ